MYENDMKIIERAQNGSKEDMTKLVEDNNGLIWSIVRRFSGRGFEIDDLYQIGCIGFIKSIQRFDTSFEVRLSTYAVPYILGEIKRYIRDDGPIKVSRSIKELNVKIVELQKEYYNKYGKEITLEEISKELRISKEEITMALDSTRPVDSIEDAQYRDNKTDKTVSILEQLSVGEEIQIIEKQGNWYQVEARGITGYLREDLIEVSGDVKDNTTEEVSTNTENTAVEENTEETVRRYSADRGR